MTSKSLSWNKIFLLKKKMKTGMSTKNSICTSKYFKIYWMLVRMPASEAGIPNQFEKR